MSAKPPPWTTLVDVASLRAASEQGSDIVLLDCRADLADVAAGARMFEAGHIPGAQHADLERDLSDMAQQGQGRHPWPHARDFAACVARWGVDEDTQVVAYDAGNGMFAARAWCLLRWFGHARVAVLDGGLAAWQAAGGACAQGPAVPRAPTPLREADFAAGRLFDHEDVIAHLAHGGVLLDARAGERFRGEIEPLDARAGHVPGAVNRPFAENLDAQGRFKPREVLFDEFAALLGGRTPSDMVAMCGSGVSACHHLLAMAHAGLEGAKLYKGSWSGWVSDPARPVATGA
ncbi:sulfurtransferase [Luteimonas sp. e5]